MLSQISEIIKMFNNIKKKKLYYIGNWIGIKQYRSYMYYLQMYAQKPESGKVTFTYSRNYKKKPNSY